MYVNSCAHSLLSPFTLSHHVNKSTVFALIWPHPNTASLWRALRRRKGQLNPPKIVTVDWPNPDLAHPLPHSNLSVLNMCWISIWQMKENIPTLLLTDWRDNGKNRTVCQQRTFLITPLRFWQVLPGLLKQTAQTWQHTWHWIKNILSALHEVS